MNGRRLVSLVFVLSLLLSAAQCGGKEEGRQASSPAGQIAATQAEAAPGSPASAPGNLVRLRQVRVMDQDGTGIEALRLMTPADWQTQARVYWRLDVPFLPAVVPLRATSADGAAEFELLPGQVFAWTDNELTSSIYPPGSRYYGAEVMQPLSAQAALRSLVLPRFRGDVGNLSIVSETPFPELAQVAYQSAQQRPGLTIQTDAAKVRVTYERGGRQVEEEICAAVECFSYQFQTMYGPRTNTQWYVDYAFSGKADRGSLDKLGPTFASIAQSIVVNPLWMSKVGQLQEWLAQQQIERIQSVGQLSQMLAQTSNEVSDMMMDSYNKRQAANDRIAQGWSDHTLGIDRYSDASGGQVELPAGYKAAWTNGNGEYLVTDQTGYNPNEGSTQNWQQLTK